MAAGRTHVKVPKASTSATMIRRKPAMDRRRSESLEHVPSIVYDVLREPGKPLDSATRSAAGERLGFSFENVRVHDDLRAAASAEAICAQAYTVGGHVIFGRNRYAPHSAVGRELLYHELCHVAQQGAQTPGVPAQSLELGRTDSPQESHAEAMAAAAAHGDGHGGRLGATSQPAPALPGHVIARTESSEPDPEALAELIRHAQQQQAASPAPAAAIRPWSEKEPVYVVHSPSGLVAVQETTEVEDKHEGHSDKAVGTSLQLENAAGKVVMFRDVTEQKRYSGDSYIDKGPKKLADGTVLPAGKVESHHGIRRKDIASISSNAQAYSATTTQREATGYRAKAAGVDEYGRYHEVRATHGTRLDNTYADTNYLGKNGRPVARVTQSTSTRNQGSVLSRLINRGTENVNLSMRQATSSQGRTDVGQVKVTQYIGGPRIEEHSQNTFEGKASGRELDRRLPKGYQLKGSLSAASGDKRAVKSVDTEAAGSRKQEGSFEKKKVYGQVEGSMSIAKPGAMLPARQERPGSAIVTGAVGLVEKKEDWSPDHKRLVDQEKKDAYEDKDNPNRSGSYTQIDTTDSLDSTHVTRGDSGEINDFGASYNVQKEVQKGIIWNFLRKDRHNYGWFVVENALNVATLQGRQYKGVAGAKAGADNVGLNGEIGGAAGSIDTMSDEVTVRDTTLGLFVSLKGEGEFLAGADAKMSGDAGWVRGAGLGAGNSASVFAGLRLKLGGTISIGLQGVVVGSGTYRWLGMLGGGGGYKFEARYLNGAFVLSGSFSLAAEAGLGAGVEMRINPRALVVALGKGLGNKGAGVAKSAEMKVLAGRVADTGRRAWQWLRNRVH